MAKAKYNKIEKSSDNWTIVGWVLTIVSAIVTIFVWNDIGINWSNSPPLNPWIIIPILIQLEGIYILWLKYYEDDVENGPWFGYKF
jgi:hypothetical protein